MSEIHTTNQEAISAFEEALQHYEASVTPTSNNLREFLHPAQLLKKALEKIVVSHHSDTYSMMRILVTHITGNKDTLYADVTLSMLCAATPDERTKELIFSIAYVLREMIDGDTIDLDEAWLARLENNHAIHTFIKNYNLSDQGYVEETYSGNVIKPNKGVTKITTNDLDVLITIGKANYTLTLTSRVCPSVNFAVSTEENWGDQGVIVSEIILTPNVGYLKLDKSILFFDDAKAQIDALHCAPQGVSLGQDTYIHLPRPYYRLALNVMSSDAGKIWRVTEVNILPPSQQ